MKSPFDTRNSPTNTPLKLDVLSGWLETEWVAKHPEADLQVLWTSEVTANSYVLERFGDDVALAEDYRYAGRERFVERVVPSVMMESSAEEITYKSGGWLYKFRHQETDAVTELLMVATFTSDDFYDEDMICLLAVSEPMISVWQAFVRECKRIDRSLKPQQKVHIIGGWASSFSPDTEWDQIILPEDLKTSIHEDISSFFSKGVNVYKRLNLKPFRKLLFAGVPGTGKTMLCSALAKWALDQEYIVAYISSADEEGPTFRKIQRALSIVSRSDYPALVILEELDAYLHNEEKALVLNVLDGSEGQTNEHGTLLIATTNYPEAIDERVLKRPGRLDRIFIVPEMDSAEDTEKMLRLYLADMWQDDHLPVAEALVGYPGAFVREVAIYALTQVARDDLDVLSPDLLQGSFDSLRDQISMRDDFLVRKGSMGYRNAGFNTK